MKSVASDRKLSSCSDVLKFLVQKDLAATGVVVPLLKIRNWLDRLRMWAGVTASWITRSGLQQHGSAAYMGSIAGVLRQLIDNEEVLKGLHEAELAIAAVDTAQEEAAA